MRITSKKGVELALQTIVIFILAIIVLLFITFMFTDIFSGNTGTIFGISDSVSQGNLP